MSAEAERTDAAEDHIPAASPAVAWASDILQGLLIFCVVAWVLDLPRRLFGLALYTEQLLAICLGLGLALTFISTPATQAARIEWGGVLAAAAIVAYALYSYASFGDVPPLMVLAFALALLWAAIGGRLWAARWFDWIGAATALIICAYIADRYEALTYEIALLPTDGVVGSAILLLLVLEATRRTSGGVLVGIILILSVYVFIGPHMPGDFATRPVSPGG